MSDIGYGTEHSPWDVHDPEEHEEQETNA